MNQSTLNGIVISIALAALTACGGTTSPSSESIGQTPQLVAAPAQGAQPNTEDAIPMPQPSTAEPSTAAASNPPASTPLPSTDNAIVDEVTASDAPFVADQMILGAATDVGCDADAVVFQQTMLELVNASRVEARMCGSNLRAAVETVTWNDKLTEAARMHGVDMATNNFFSHDGSDGLAVSNRAESAGYAWRAVGENIAAGQLDQAEVHQGWLDSEGHCVNIMNQLFTEIGAACVSNPGADFGTYWVVVFGDAK